MKISSDLVGRAFELQMKESGLVDSVKNFYLFYAVKFYLTNGDIKTALYRRNGKALFKKYDFIDEVSLQYFKIVHRVYLGYLPRTRL